MVVGSNIHFIANNLLRKYPSKVVLGIRSKFSAVYGIPEIYIPPVYDNSRQEFLKKLKNVTERVSNSKFAQKMRVAKGFYTLEMAPPASSGEIKQMQEELKSLIDFFKSGSYKNVTVNDAWLFILVATEVGLWFYLGETIGKWHIVGYKV